MKGPFVIVFLDWFGLEHKWVIWAQSTEEALRNVKIDYAYPITEIKEIYFDWKLAMAW